MINSVHFPHTISAVAQTGHTSFVAMHDMVAQNFTN
jgi:hypothetical protein